MQEKPLERLNYYNGMAVDAAGFKTEQDYHISVRRWLNKSLYSAGIASGLEVRAAGTGPNVLVSPGLALDSAGREIILLEETLVEVCSYSGTNAATVVGNYLVIEYGEETTEYESACCAVRSTVSTGIKSTSKWGGPSRVQANPKFSWVPFPPPPGANQIVLAKVELTQPNCDGVNQIDAGARRYIGAASAAKVRQFALEGEREVAFIPKEQFPAVLTVGAQPNDVDVIGRIYFHIRGGQPNSVTLYLRAEQFSPTHYSELGGHTHAAEISGTIADHTITRTDLNHSHSLDGIITDIEKDDDTFSDGASTFPPHAHYLFGRTGNLGGNLSGPVITIGAHKGFGIANTDALEQVIGNGIGNDDPDVEIRWGRHRHRLTTEAGSGAVKTQDGPASTFTNLVLQHSVSGIDATISSFGVSEAREGTSITFVHDLQISLGQVGHLVNKTTEITSQLGDSYPANWLDGTRQPKTLGDGTSNHVLALQGTGAVRLDFLTGVTFAEGEYCIELKVDAKEIAGKRVANGGKILYNLYVE